MNWLAQHTKSLSTCTSFFFQALLTSNNYQKFVVVVQLCYGHLKMAVHLPNLPTIKLPIIFFHWTQYWDTCLPVKQLGPLRSQHDRTRTISRIVAESDKLWQVYTSKHFPAMLFINIHEYLYEKAQQRRGFAIAKLLIQLINARQSGEPYR